MAFFALRDFRFFPASLVALVPGFVPKRALTIGPPLCVHLQDSQIDPQLDLFLAVSSPKPTGNDMARTKIPFLQKVADVKTHAGTMEVEC